MKLHVIGSGSSGNCYVLKASTGESVIIEAGCSLKDLLKEVEIIPSKCAFILVSHEHGDHAKFVNDYVASGIPLVTTEKIATELCVKKFKQCTDQWHRNMSFCVLGEKVNHDSVECLSFQIHHEEMGYFSFITDTNDLVEMPETDHWLIEANYDHSVVQERINKGESNIALAERVANNHMSIEKCIENIKYNAASWPAPKTITLCHLSKDHSDAKLFKKKVFDAVAIIPEIAKKGLIREL